MPSRQKLLSFLAIAFAAALFAQGGEGQSAYRWVDEKGRVHYGDQKPQENAKDVQEKRLGLGNVIDSSRSGLPPEYPVTLYSSPDCTSACTQARELLRNQAVPFTEKPLKTEQDAEEFRRSTRTKELLVPTLTVGSQVSTGYDESTWSRLLKAAGYGPAPGQPSSAGNRSPLPSTSALPPPTAR